MSSYQGVVDAPTDQMNDQFFPIIVGIIVGGIALTTIISTTVIIYKMYKQARMLILNKTQDREKIETLNPQFLVVSDSQMEGNIEQFLSDIIKEKPLQFSPQQLGGFTKHFSKVLGAGGFGVVYKGEFSNGMQIAVKVLKNTSNSRAAEQFMAELGTIGRTYHINLVRLYGFCFNSTIRALVYEYMEFGSLDKLLFTNLKYSIDFETLHQIAIGTGKAIAYLHEECQKRIIHYDIKPENILLDMNFKPKVADFGLAMLYNQDSSHVVLSGYRGTPGYAAPEMWTSYLITDHKCDVYSFGMLLFEIIGKRKNCVPYIYENNQEWFPKLTYKKFKKDELSDILIDCGIQDKELEKANRMVMVALWCVQYLPKSRPLMSFAVKMLEGGVGIDTPPNPFEHFQN